MNKAQKQKVREEFREKFLMKGSECTWEGYPEPEEVETYLIQKLEEQERKLVRRIEKFHTESAKADVELKDFPEYCRGWDTALALLLNSLKQE